jgi:hypothetical protein
LSGAAAVVVAAVVVAAVLEGAVAGDGAIFCETLGGGDAAGAGGPVSETDGGSAAGCGMGAAAADADAEGVETEGVEGDGAGEAVALWRPTDPVTVSRPCSRTVTREYNRSRSLFKVSMADANRLVSF